MTALCTAIGATQWPPVARIPGTNVGWFVGHQSRYGGLPLKSRNERMGKAGKPWLGMGRLVALYPQVPQGSGAI